MRLSDRVTNGLHDLSRTVKGLLLIFALVVPVASVSFAAGGYLATAALEDDLKAVEESVGEHVSSAQLHVVTRTELDRINRRLCRLMAAQDIADADCP